jgi:hypothetical protein
MVSMVRPCGAVARMDSNQESPLHAQGRIVLTFSSDSRQTASLEAWKAVIFSLAKVKAIWLPWWMFWDI